MEIERFMTKFKKMDGTKITNVAEYVKDYLASHPNEQFELFIGTDSQKVRKRRVIWYATVLCLYRVGKGAHIIYAKENRTDVIGISNKLMEEINYSISVAMFLKENGVLYNNSLTTLHLDLSPEIENESNKVYKNATGWVTGLGFEYRTKPLAVAASYAADMCVRKGI